MSLELSSRDIHTCNCTAMRKASRRLSQVYDAALAPVGLRSTQYSLLLELSHHIDESPTMREIADSMVMDRSTLVRNIKPLEREHLISIQSLGLDRRRRFITLTQQGKKKLHEARPYWKAAQETFERRFGPTPADELRKILLKIASDVD